MSPQGGVVAGLEAGDVALKVGADVHAAARTDDKGEAKGEARW